MDIGHWQGWIVDGSGVPRYLDYNDRVTIDTKIKVLRDRTVNWLWKAHKAVNKPEIVKVCFSYMIGLYVITHCILHRTGQVALQGGRI